MFRRFATVNSTFRTLCTAAGRPSRRWGAAAAVAPIAILAFAAPALAGDPWHGRQRVEVRPRIVIRTPAPVHARPHRTVHRHPIAQPRRDVVPCELTFSAYQSGCTVIVVANGHNTSSGFTTSLHAEDCGRSPTLRLCNSLPAGQCVTPALTPFNVSTSFHAERPVRSVTVDVAGRSYCVPVSVVRGHR